MVRNQVSLYITVRNDSCLLYDVSTYLEYCRIYLFYCVFPKAMLQWYKKKDLEEEQLYNKMTKNKSSFL